MFYCEGGEVVCRPLSTTGGSQASYGGPVSYPTMRIINLSPRQWTFVVLHNEIGGADVGLLRGWRKAEFVGSRQRRGVRAQDLPESLSRAADHIIDRSQAQRGVGRAPRPRFTAPVQYLTRLRFVLRPRILPTEDSGRSQVRCHIERLVRKVFCKVLPLLQSGAKRTRSRGTKLDFSHWAARQTASLRVPRMPIRFLAGRCRRPTRKKSPKPPRAEIAPSRAHEE